MKRLILLEFALLFLASTFMSDAPPAGWYQQVLPVNDQINDIFFLDSLTGWVVTNSNLNPPDSGYIIKTTDAGNNWSIQHKDIIRFNKVQFLNQNTGYAGAEDPTARIYKSTNGGNNWTVVSTALTGLSDLFFVNKDTGWYCDPSGFGGIFKTVNGGTNWQQQMSASNSPKTLFFLNKDTGWAGSNEASGKLYQTTNGGSNWVLQYTFTAGISDVFYISKDSGWVTGGGGGTGIMRTINGGFNWFATNNPTPFGDSRLYFYDNKHGWAGSGQSKIVATKDGVNWGYQTTPNYTHYNVFFIDTLKGWAGGGGNDIIHTNDGGGPLGINQISSEIPSDYKLYQNYPNPFNPITIIKYEIVKNKYQSKALVQLKIFDITGKEILTLVNEEQSAGTYEADFDGSGYSSGVYFYRLLITNRKGGVVYTETKKAVLAK